MQTSRNYPELQIQGLDQRLKLPDVLLEKAYRGRREEREELKQSKTTPLPVEAVGLFPQF